MRPCIFLAAILLPLAAQAASSAWPHENSDIPPDPEIVWGRLDNGLRYAIRPSTEPKGRASLRLVVLAGSARETDEQQRGLAHFVEHMAFNGTRLYPKETLFKVLQRHGMAGGADVNAFTALNHTFYKLELPGTSAEQLGEGLQVLREFADGVTFDPAEVDRERGVIESERLARADRNYRVGEAYRNFVFAGGLLATRNPIGLTTIIQQSTAEDLRHFYDRWYRADNMLLVATGDFTPAAVEALVHEKFASLARHEDALPPLDLTLPATPTGFVAGIQSEPEARGPVTLEFSAVRPHVEQDTRAYRTGVLLRALAFGALNVRLHSIRIQESKRLGSLEARYDNNGAYYELAIMHLETNGAKWKDGVARAEQELRRALTYGFTATELREASANLLAMFEASAKSAGTRASAVLADHIAFNVETGRVVNAPALDLALAREVFAQATPQSCLEAFRRAWGEGAPRLFASGTLPEGVGSVQLVEAARDSARKRIDPPKDTKMSPFAYTDFGPPGAIAQRRHLDDLDVHLVEFANGVKLNLKATKHEANSVHLIGYFGTGNAGEPPKKPGLRLLMDHGFAAFGLGRHDREQLAHLSSGILAGVAFDTIEDAFIVTGSSDSDNTERMLQLLTAHFADPGWRKTALSDARSAIMFDYLQNRRNIGSYLAVQRLGRLTGKDPRYEMPASKTAVGYDVGDLRDWLGPQLATGPLEIGIVGDFDVEEMIDLASRTIGCLPKRRASAAVPPVNFLSVATASPFIVASGSKQGAVQLTWAIPPGHDHLSRRRLELLTSVLRNRLMNRLREDMGATYSANCSVWRSRLQPDNGYVVASLLCEPADTIRLAEAARDVADKLAHDSVTDDEFERARQPALQEVPARLNSNGAWLGWIGRAQSEPEYLDLPRTATNDYNAITAADVAKLAAIILPADRASFFTAVPDQKK